MLESEIDIGELAYDQDQCLFEFPRQFETIAEFNRIQELFVKIGFKRAIFRNAIGDIIFNGKQAIGECRFFIDPVSSQLLNYNKDKLLKIMDNANKVEINKKSYLRVVK